MAFERKIRKILTEVTHKENVELGPIMGHRLCGTNGNHAYGCLICKKQDRYCQLFQLHHYGEAIDNQQKKEKIAAGSCQKTK